MKIWLLLLCLAVRPALAKDAAVHKDCYLKPCELSGDFDGDKKPDVATLVSDGKKRRGIEVKFASKKTVVLGAGQLFGNGGDSFEWMDSWSVHRGKIEPGADESEKPPAAKGDSLYLEKLESASGLVYWTGTKFEWYQQGD